MTTTSPRPHRSRLSTWIGRLAVCAALLPGAHAASANTPADWPSKPIRLIVGFPPGSSRM